MQIRVAEPDDAAAIREVAHVSLHVSYEDDLGEETIHEALDRWYEVEALAEEITEDDVHYLVAEDDGEVVGFSESLVLDAEGRIEWLHVHPDDRGVGVGAALLGRTRDELARAGVEHVLAEVLAANEAGNEFYAEHGFSLFEQHTVEVGGQLQPENLYVDVASVDRELEPVETPEGTKYVDFADEHRGRDGLWYPVYRGEDGSRRFGWYCDACGSVDNAMDTLDRIVCNECGNVRKPTRWDAAYL